MLVAELVLRKLNTEDEIKELENYISNLSTIKSDNYSDLKDLYQKTTKELFSLYDKLQRQRVVLNKCNFSNKIALDDQEITVADAMEVLNTIEKRLNLYTNLINNGDINIDFIAMLSERRSLLEEYLKLTAVIKESDWSTKID